MSDNPLVTTLKAMKLHGMAGAIAELAEQGSPAFKQSGDLLGRLAHHCHILETGNDSYRLKHSSTRQDKEVKKKKKTKT